MPTVSVRGLLNCSILTKIQGCQHGVCIKVFTQAYATYSKNDCQRIGKLKIGLYLDIDLDHKRFKS